MYAIGNRYQEIGTQTPYHSTKQRTRRPNGIHAELLEQGRLSAWQLGSYLLFWFCHLVLILYVINFQSPFFEQKKHGVELPGIFLIELFRLEITSAACNRLQLCSKGLNILGVQPAADQCKAPKIWWHITTETENSPLNASWPVNGFYFFKLDVKNDWLSLPKQASFTRYLVHHSDQIRSVIHSQLLWQTLICLLQIPAFLQEPCHVPPDTGATMWHHLSQRRDLECRWPVHGPMKRFGRYHLSLWIGIKRLDLDPVKHKIQAKIICSQQNHDPTAWVKPDARTWDWQYLLPQIQMSLNMPLWMPLGRLATALL